MDYREFLEKKSRGFQNAGFECDDFNPMLFDWQRLIVKWALKKGRAAIMAACGLGKTPMQLEWANMVSQHTGKAVLMLAPLAVSKQTMREGKKFGIKVNIAESQDDVVDGINITNYEKLHKFDPGYFAGIVLDESGILKSFTSKTRNKLIESFGKTPYRLCCTATPAPNDYMELGNHSEFLGVMSRSEMLSMYFINDTANVGNWRLKGHVEKNIFWEWLSTWSVMISKPSDIGFENHGFDLPSLNIKTEIIKYDTDKFELFSNVAETLTERREARKESLGVRVKMASDIVNNSSEQFLCWCDFNAESEALSNEIDGAIEVTGSDKPEFKESSMMGFQDEKIKCLVTKPKIAGFGMNWQNCHNMIFCGLSDSYEQMYQAIRRCWRFGQNSDVNVHIIIGERETATLENIKRKERDMKSMQENMIIQMRKNMEKELNITTYNRPKYEPKKSMTIPNFLEA